MVQRAKSSLTTTTVTTCRILMKSMKTGKAASPTHKQIAV